MHVSEMYPSRWLSAKDVIEGEDLTVTIKQIKEEQINGESKWVLYFNEEDKGLVLNQTNAKSIAKLYGEETREWLGKRITLFCTEVQFKGDMVEALRIRSKPPSKLARQAESATAPRRKVEPVTQAEIDADEPY